jgi:hypothetical protein
LEGEYNKRLKIFTDGSLKDKRVGYAIVIPKTIIKNQMRIQTTIFSAEQEAIIKAIYISNISKGKEATVIAKNCSLRKWKKTSKTRRIRELLDQKKEGSN